MEKTKKMSKTSIAVIVLAILLALSMIMGITGAWFTDKAEGRDTELTFGKIQISAPAQDTWSVNGGVARAHALLDSSEIMPGDTVQYTGNVDNQGDPAYVFAQFSGKIVRTEADYYASLDAAGKAAYDALADAAAKLAARTEDLATKLAGVSGVALAPAGWSQYESTGVYYVLLEKDGAVDAEHDNAALDAKSFTLTYVLDGSLFDNSYQNAELSVELDFYAVQEANRTAAEAYAIAFN